MRPSIKFINPKSNLIVHHPPNKNQHHIKLLLGNITPQIYIVHMPVGTCLLPTPRAIQSGPLTPIRRPMSAVLPPLARPQDPRPTVTNLFFFEKKKSPLPARFSFSLERGVFKATISPTISPNSPMPTVLLRISLICHLLNTLLLYFLPRKLSSLLPSSWLPRGCPEKPAPDATKVPSHRHSPRSSQPGMEPSELKRVFQMFDRNGDGRIMKKELSDSLENLGIYIPEGDLESMIGKIDANGDGCVDIEEFGALYQTIMDDRDEEEDMREAFNVFDQNGDGFITVEELRSVLTSLGLKQGRTVEDCRRMINKVDVDGDGMVDFKEFKQMMRGGGFAALS